MEEQKRINVLDYGFVELCNVYGSDYTILESARISTGGEAQKGDKQDQGLINYMYKNAHSTPFEHVIIRLHIKMPIFVMRQWIRHRTQSVNEFSSRYSEMPEEMYVPQSFKYQDKKNHQGSAQPIEEQENILSKKIAKDTMDVSFDAYERFLRNGVSKEQSRIVLPVSQYTEFYTTMNLWNLFHLLYLRLHEHAQWEIRQFAEAILTLLKREDSIKWSMKIFEKKNELDYLYLAALNKYKDLSSLKGVLQIFVEEEKKE